ncbi:PEP-CTERM sorting domain-containing protein [Nostoc sp. TCL26-01]|uniref:PEP-CTERM sorting domain-containing protein n=1 Tax=Nostoc sp. TCL26-01 TaxID=2576904 RepID=UPI0015BB50BE|nr:PEP-CTERM sorting domain-containing protein [Nostoc sp. TCL26-01]QLE56030.1 PEP-CTERM sorting domain-containing protein [Nostoc sp. TCL26-01]
MTSSIFKTLAAVTVGTTLIFAAGETMPSQAATITYNFANTDKTLTGYFSFDESAALDHIIEVSEGLKIVANYGGQTYTEADDALAAVWTDLSGKVPNGQFLGLQFVTSNFTVASDYFIVGDASSTITYSSVPEPTAILGLSVIGLGLLVSKNNKAKSSV